MKSIKQVALIAGALFLFQAVNAQTISDSTKAHKTKSSAAKMKADSVASQQAGDQDNIQNGTGTPGTIPATPMGAAASGVGQGANGNKPPSTGH
jgi:hypothetical protein